MKILFAHHDGHIDEVDGEPGTSLMEIAITAGVDGIDADCGGQLSCATCHVHIAQDWLGKLPKMSSDEDALLDFAPSRDERSRLCCQIICTPEMDGLSVTVPESQQ